MQMQVVVNIPDNIWASIQNEEYCGILNAEMYKNIKNGTPLSEGHWELDKHLDKIGMIYKYKCSECGKNQRAMYDYCPSCGSHNGGDVNVSDK